MKHLVTGATGLLGCTLLYELAKSNKSIIALKRERSNLKRVEAIFCMYDPEKGSEIFKTIQWQNVDIKNPVRLEEIFETGISRVYHIAGLVSFNAAHKKRLMQTNYEATKEIVNLSLHYGIEKLAYVSSIATINKLENTAEYDEKSGFDTMNSTYYAKSKYLGEKEVWRGTQEGLPAIIIKPGVILASAHFSTESSGAIIKQAIESNFATNGVVGFVDVRDVAKSICELMDSQICNESYIAVSENTSYLEFFDKVKAIAKLKPARAIPEVFLHITGGISNAVSFLNDSWDFLPKGLKNSLVEKTAYNNSKLKEAISYNLLSLDESLNDYIPKYLDDKQK